MRAGCHRRESDAPAGQLDEGLDKLMFSKLFYLYSYSISSAIAFNACYACVLFTHEHA